MNIKALKNFPYHIILGSASPRRKQLLSDLGFDFTVETIDADETSWPQELKGGDIAQYLAEKKAAAFPRSLLQNELLVCGDTIVWQSGKIFNKPADAKEATIMLKNLSGCSHEVFTGICLRSGTKQKSFYDRTTVYFRKLGEDEIEHYITNFKPFDKAGSYGVQDWIGYVGIEKIEGSFYNVMGLPVQRLYQELLSF